MSIFSSAPFASRATKFDCIWSRRICDELIASSCGRGRSAARHSDVTVTSHRVTRFDFLKTSRALLRLIATSFTDVIGVARTRCVDCDSPAHRSLLVTTLARTCSARSSTRRVASCYVPRGRSSRFDSRGKNKKERNNFLFT